MQAIQTTEAETLTDDEIAALTADAPAEEGTGPEAFCPDTADKVDWVLGKIAAARAEAKLIRENMEAMARAIERLRRAGPAVEPADEPAKSFWPLPAISSDSCCIM